MKAAVIFDVHLWNHKRFGGPLIRGINRRGVLTLQTLRAAIKSANIERAQLIVAGDLVDEAGPIQPQFAAAIRTELLQANNGVFLVLGNHDLNSVDDDSLRVYEHSTIRVVDEITRIGDCDLVPFCADFTDPRVDAPVVVAHFGVFDDQFPGFMKKSADAWHVARLFAFMRERGIRCAALGDWHSRYVWSLPDSVLSTALPSGEQHRSVGRPKADQGGWGRVCGPTDLQQSDIFSYRLSCGDSLIMQGGSLNPTGFDNKGLHGYGTLAIVDTGDQSLSWRELPGPRFATVHDSEEQAALITEAGQLGHSLFLRRYFEGARPEKPASVEGFEALPIALQQKAKMVLGIDSISATGRFESLVSEWLESIRATHGDAAPHERLLRKYL